MIKHKITVTAVLVIFLSIYLCSCKTENITEEVNVLSLDFWTVSKAHAQYMETCAQEYNQQTDGTRVKLNIKIYSRNQIAEKLWMAFRSGSNIPDLVDVHYRDFAFFITPSDLKFYPLNLRLSKYPELVDVNTIYPFMVSDTCFGLPYSSGEMVVFYNSDILSRYNMDASKIKSWQDYVNAGMTIAVQGGPKMVALDLNNLDYFYYMMAQSGALNSELTLEEMRETQAYVEVTQLLCNMVTQSQVAEIAPGYDIYNQNFFDAFEAGEYVSIIAPLEYAVELITNLPHMQQKLIAYSVPALDGSIVSGTSAQFATAVTTSCEDVSTAKDFVFFAHATHFAFTKATDTLYVRNIGKTESAKTMSPDNAVFTRYFRGNPIKLVISDTQPRSYLSCNTNIIELSHLFVKDLLERVD